MNVQDRKIQIETNNLNANTAERRANIDNLNAHSALLLAQAEELNIKNRAMSRVVEEKEEPTYTKKTASRSAVALRSKKGNRRKK